MSATEWGSSVEGVITGPSEEIEVVDGTVRVELFWDTDEGVQLHVDSTDVFLSPSEWLRVRAAIDRLLSQTIPQEGAGA